MSTSTTGVEDATKKYRAEYYERNKEALLASMKEWREANPEKVRKSQENWKRNNEGRTYKDASSGYVFHIGFDHPAANPSGVTAYHRVVLWDKLDGQDAPCHVCGGTVYWEYPFGEYDSLVVDHLNNVRDDNRPENLAPAHSYCNITRPGNRVRTGARTVVGTCEGPECDRPAKTHAGTNLVCGSHYNQWHAGKELTPLRTLKRSVVSDEGRLCTRCDEVKPHSEFYVRKNGKAQQRCKTCMIENTKVRRDERLARNTTCSDDGCAEPVDIKGLCTKHYVADWYASKGGDAK